MLHLIKVTDIKEVLAKGLKPNKRLDYKEVVNLLPKKTCSGESILPSVTLPSVTLPSVTLPSVTLPLHAV
jgi:hypothetical protein